MVEGWVVWVKQETMYTDILETLRNAGVQVERDLSNKSFQAYTNRYIYPYKESGSPSPHFYSFDMAGESLWLNLHIDIYSNTLIVQKSLQGKFPFSLYMFVFERK